MRDRHRRLVGLGVSLVALVVVAPALAARAASPPRFGGERTDVVAVEIPLQVVRDGEPVRGLTRSDFVIYEGKKKQAITGFEVIDLAATPAAPLASGATGDGLPQKIPVLSPAARRHFLILFDLANSEARSIVQARAAVQKVVDQLHPTDLVAVASHSPSAGPKILLGFTADRRQIATAIENLGVPELLKRSGDPLKLVLLSSHGSEAISGLETNSGKPAEIFESFIRNRILRSQVNDRQIEIQRLKDYTRALEDLGRLMASVQGRKYVVLLSEGFDSSLLLGSTDEVERAQQQTAAEKGQYWNVDSDTRFGSATSANDLEAMLEAFRRADCVIQAVDIGGVREGGQGFERPNGQDGLFAMADQTGGELFRNFNNLAEAMGKMLDRTSVTYVLSFQPTILRDGAYHPVRVELAKPARGTRISHRAGYYAPKPFDPKDAEAHLLDAAELITTGREGGTLDVSVVAAPYPGSDGISYVPVVVAVGSASLLAGTESGPLPTEIYAYALAPDGTIGDYFGQTLGLDLSKVKSKLLLGSGLKYYGHLELPPGQWSLRVLVRNGRTGDSGLRVSTVSVPSFEPGAPTLLTPYFLDTPDAWLMVREQPRGDQPDTPYPFTLHQQRFVPAVQPILSADQTASLALVGYHLPEGAASELSAAARVTDAAGKPVPGGEARLLSREAQGDDREALVVSFKPASLPPGQYRLSFHLASGADAFGLDSGDVPFEVQ